MPLMKRAAAELVGTFWLVLGGCGSAVLAAAFPHLGIGFLGVALAFGLTVVTMAYAVGHISGGHFNPAVTLGLVAGGRFDADKSVGYIIAQCLGAVAAAGLVYVIAQGAPKPLDLGNFASNAYGTAATYSIQSVFLIEAALTAFFLLVIMGVTSKGAAPGFAPIAIGLTLGAIHMMAIPVSNCSVNPARSLATSLFGGQLAIQQVWMFWVAPIAGAVLGGTIGRWLYAD